MEFFIQKPQKGLKNKKIKLGSGEIIEPEEVFLDNLAQKKEEDLGISEKKFEIPLSKRILQGFYFISIILLLILFSKSFYFQIIQGKEFSQKSKNNSEKLIFERPDRGVIYDKNDELLVSNLPSFDLVVDRRDLPKDELEKTKVIKNVSKIINTDSETLETQINNITSPVMLVSENLEHETLLKLEPKINDLPGFYIEKNTTRDYKSSYTFSHVMGFVGRVNKTEYENNKNYSITDYIGKTGIEKIYEKELRGIPGITVVEKDVMGKEKKREQTSVAEAGKSLKLNIDASLQEKLEGALQASLERVGAKKGIAVALDPNNGGVLALVSLPSFNSNLFSQGITQEQLDKLNNSSLKPLFNRVVSGEYVVGSTIKPLMGIAGLEEKVITSETKINDFEAKICIPNKWNPEITECFEDLSAHGIVDVRKAIAVSCNVFFYTVGGGFENFKGLGIEKIKKWLTNFGWGKETGIDLNGEASGSIPDPAWKKQYLKYDKDWFLGDTYNLSIGQGYIQVTPLQVASAYMAIANGGKLYQPQVVKEILDNNKNIIKKIEPKIIKENFFNKENADTVKQGLRDAVLYGSSTYLKSLPVAVGAKTGTAQINRADYYLGWVNVIAPLENPEIVLTVMVEDVPGLQAAALPVAKEVLEWYFNRLSK